MLDQYRQEYKELLIRYKNGCNFLSGLNPKDNKYDFYLSKLLEILNRINEIVSEYPELVKEKEI